MTAPPLGIDISKLKFDACLIRAGGSLRHSFILNSPAGYDQLSAWLEMHKAAPAHD